MVKTIRQVLAECSLEQLTSVGRLWSLAEIEKKQPRTTYQNVLVERMQDVIAARLLWEQLTEDERTVLNLAILPSSRYGVMQAALQKKAQMTPERFEIALHRLVFDLLIQTYTVTATSSVATSSKKSKEEKAPLLMVAAFSDNMKALYAVAQEFAQEAKDRSKLKFDKLLATVSDADMQHILRSHKISRFNYTIRPEDRIAIAEEIATHENPLEDLTDLSAKEREVFKWVCDQGGKVPMQKLREHTSMENIALLDLLHGLAQHALAFDTFSQKEYQLFVPQDIYLNVKDGSKPGVSEEKSELKLLEAAPPVIRAEEPAMLYDIATLTNAVFQQTIEPTQQGRLPKRVVTKLRPQLRGIVRTNYEGNDTYTDMLFAVMKQLHIVKLTKPAFPEEKAHYEPGINFAGWAELDVLGQTKIVFANAWLAKHTFIDIITVHDQESYNDFYNLHAALAPPTLIKYLSTCTPERWYSVASLLDVMWQTDPFVLRYNPPRARQADRKKGSELYKKWLRLEGNVYTGMLSSSLHEMGIVSLGYDQIESNAEDRRQLPEYFLLSDLGAKAIEWMQKEVMDRFGELQKHQGTRGGSFGSPLESDLLVNFNSLDYLEDDDDGEFGDEDEYEDGESVEKIGMNLLQSDHREKQAPQRVLVVQPNFELLLMQPDFPTLYSLLPFAQVNQIGLVSRLTLTKASLQHGRQNGLSNEEMLQVLREHSQKELPQNVVYTMQDWTKDYKSATAMQVLLLDVSGEDVVKMIREAKVLAKFGLRVLGPTTIAVTESINVRELKRDLEKLGIFTNIKGTITEPSRSYNEPMYGRYR